MSSIYILTLHFGGSSVVVPCTSVEAGEQYLLDTIFNGEYKTTIELVDYFESEGDGHYTVELMDVIGDSKQENL